MGDAGVHWRRQQPTGGGRRFTSCLVQGHTHVVMLLCKCSPWSSNMLQVCTSHMQHNLPSWRLYVYVAVALLCVREYGTGHVSADGTGHVSADGGVACATRSGFIRGFVISLHLCTHDQLPSVA